MSDGDPTESIVMTVTAVDAAKPGVITLTAPDGRTMRVQLGDMVHIAQLGSSLKVDARLIEAHGQPLVAYPWTDS